METIGFIGLGHMGKPMVKNLLNAGYSVNIFDIVPAAVEEVAALGAMPVASIATLATKSTIVFTMLQTGQQVKSVCLGEEGLFHALAPKSLYIDCSSIDILSCRELHQLALENNIAMLDAPVSGGVAGATAGTLTIMVGGQESHFLVGKKILQHLGKNVIHAGGAGNGQAAKICNNMILGISMIAVSEGFVLANALGLDPEKFFEIVNNSSGQCWSMTKYCPMPGVLENVPSNNQFAPGFAAAMMLKDLKLSQAAASHADVATPLGAEAAALYSLFVNAGNANLDFSAIIKMIAGMT